VAAHAAYTVIVSSPPTFKHLTKKQYDALGADAKLDYLVAAIQAKSDVLYRDPAPRRARKGARKAKR